MPSRPSTELLLVQVLLRTAMDLLRLYEAEEAVQAERALAPAQEGGRDGAGEADLDKSRSN